MKKDSKSLIHPFKNETESVSVDELTIENRLDRVSVYGRLEITKDHRGLKNLREIIRFLNDVEKELINCKLPEEIQNDAAVIVQNPFESPVVKKPTIVIPIKKIKYGCHYDFVSNMKPYGCVLDTGCIQDCTLAKPLKEKNKQKADCPEWRIVEEKS